MASVRPQIESRTRSELPLRRCIVTGEVRSQAELIRFVVGPDREVVPDLSGRLPGRGLWLTSRRDIVAVACVRKKFSWAARQPVRTADDLDETVAQLLAERCVELVSLARRGGQVVFGFERVRAWLTGGARVAGGGAVLVANDGSEDGIRKLAGMADKVGVARVRSLTGAELGRALGRARVVHAALTPGRLATKIVREAGRLSGFRNEFSQDSERA